MAIASLIISILAFLVSFSSTLWKYLRERRESTIHAYTLFQKEVVPDIISIIEGFKEKQLDFSKMSNDEITNLISDDKRITISLARIEYFCVGINTHIYCVRTLNRMGGSFFLYLFDSFRPIIQAKRVKNILNGKHYDEFEKCVNKLKHMRSRARKHNKQGI